MIFDKELMFVEDDGTERTNVTTGALGRALDLGVAGWGKGRRGFVALTFHKDTTATGDPEIKLSLHTSADESFTEPVIIPLSLPMPLKKEQMAEGMSLAAPLPVMGLERYVKLHIETDGPLACTGMEAGLVLDANEV